MTGRSSDAKARARAVDPSRARLVRAGLELIHAHGYGAVGVDDICRHAGVHKGSFYHHFPSKSDLALAILDEQLELYQRELIAPSFDNDDPPLAQLDRFFRRFADFQKLAKARRGRVLGCLFGNLALELSTEDDRVRRRVRKALSTLARRFARALEQAMQRGELPRGDATAGGEQLVAYLQGVTLWSKVTDDATRAARLALGRGVLSLAVLR